MPTRRRITRVVTATAGIIFVVILVVNTQTPLNLPYGLGPYLGGAIILLGYSVIDRLLNVLAGKEKKPQEPSSVLTSPNQVFESELSPKQVGLGDIMVFKVRFKGFLDHALLQADARLPNGKIHGFPNYDTIRHNPNRFTRGKLTGPYNQEFEWKAVVPETFRPGEYLFMIRVYQRHPYPRWVAVKLYVLYWLKAHLISSIDTKALYQNEWFPIHQEEYHVIISP